MAPSPSLPVSPQVTERLVLRAPQPDDLDAMFELHADPIANRFSPSGMLSTRAEADILLQLWLEHWQRHGHGPWTIALREVPGTVIGFGGLLWRPLGSLGGSDALQLYFRFAPQNWGQGLASEMSQRALALAFDELGAAKVLAVVLPANMPSRKTLERIGMLLKGSQADVPGQPASLVYEITAERFGELPRTPAAPTPFGA